MIYNQNWYYKLLLYMYSDNQFMKPVSMFAYEYNMYFHLSTHTYN